MCLYFTDIKSTSKAPFIQQSLCNTDWFIVWFCHYSRCQSSTEHICTDGESSDCRVDYGQQSPLAADEGSISECGNHSLSEGRGEIGYDTGLNIFLKRLQQVFDNATLWACGKFKIHKYFRFWRGNVESGTKTAETLADDFVIGGRTWAKTCKAYN